MGNEGNEGRAGAIRTRVRAAACARCRGCALPRVRASGKAHPTPASGRQGRSTAHWPCRTTIESAEGAAFHHSGCAAGLRQAGRRRRRRRREGGGGCWPAEAMPIEAIMKPLRYATSMSSPPAEPPTPAAARHPSSTAHPLARRPSALVLLPNPPRFAWLIPFSPSHSPGSIDEEFNAPTTRPRVCARPAQKIGQGQQARQAPPRHPAFGGLDCGRRLQHSLTRLSGDG